MDARRLIDSGKYEEACENLWREIREKPEIWLIIYLVKEYW